MRLITKSRDIIFRFFFAGSENKGAERGRGKQSLACLGGIRCG